MRNDTNIKDNHFNPQYPIIPAITTITIPLLIGRSDKIRNVEQPAQQKATKPKQESIRVEKFEVSQYVLKLLVEKGFLKKRWVAIKEIPLNEITLIKSLGNELFIKRNGVTDSFVIKNKKASFNGLPEKIQNLLQERQKNLENEAKANQRKYKLAELIDATVCIVDLSFDMLMAMQVKTVNWTNLESYANSLREKMCLTQQTLTPLNLDFSTITDAIKSQAPEEASREIFDVLNSIYGYFDNLELEKDLETAHPNIKDTKAAILASYTLNDLFLGKIVGEKDNQKESQLLEITLQNLAKDTNFKINYQDLKANFDKMDSYIGNEDIIENTREIYKEQLRNISRPIKELSTGQSLTEQAITPQESHPFTSQEILTPPEPQATWHHQSLKPVIEPPQDNAPLIEPSPIDQTESVSPPNPNDPLQSTKLEELEVETSSQTPTIEQQETVKPRLLEPEVQPVEQAQTEVQVPIGEDMKKPSEPPPKKKSPARRLRKAIMGY
jgi:hypothetical protein